MKSRFVVVLLAALMEVACNLNTHPMLPQEVSGEWTTEDPRYQGRFMELSPTFVITGTGRDEPHVEWVDKVEIVRNGDGTAFKVYSTELSVGTHEEISFVFSPANGGEIRFRNQTPVWRRHAGAVAAN